MFRLSFMFIALLTAGCVSLDPHYDRPAAPVPATLPGAHGESTAVVGDWQKVVNDARLKKLVSIALNSNRDVQKALADIEAARAQYGETRASLFPTVDAELSHTRSKTVASGLSSASQADGAVSSFELDLFGKNQSLSRAARANFFPSISLTASAGVGSDSLSSLFSHGMQVWSFAPSISLPLFTGGSNLSQLRYAEAEKKGLIATYEKSIQSAFKDVADALARRETLSEELDAQRQYVAAEQTSLDIAMKSYQAGVGDYLSVLTAQRTLWSAKTTLLSLQQTDLNNRITLWQSLGGGAS